MWERLSDYLKTPDFKSKELTAVELGKLIKKQDRVLFKEDLIAVVKEIIRLNNEPQAKPDQIDHLGNRRIKSFSELCASRIRVGIMRMERIIKDRMSTLDSATLGPSQLVNPRPVMAVIQEFFAASQFSGYRSSGSPS